MSCNELDPPYVATAYTDPPYTLAPYVDASEAVILKEANLIPSPILFCGIEKIEAVWYKNFFVFTILLGPNMLIQIQ